MSIGVVVVIIAFKTYQWFLVPSFTQQAMLLMFAIFSKQAGDCFLGGSSLSLLLLMGDINANY